MAKTYTPGPEADAIVDRLLGTGHFITADDVVRAGLELLRKHDLEVEELLRLGDAYLAAGRMHRDADGDGMTADVVVRLKADSVKDAE
jgi:Arc/MetJ-type ribon-helix-helix transcriptional regulator